MMNRITIFLTMVTLSFSFFAHAEVSTYQYKIDPDTPSEGCMSGFDLIYASEKKTLSLGREISGGGLITFADYEFINVDNGAFEDHYISAHGTIPSVIENLLSKEGSTETFTHFEMTHPSTKRLEVLREVTMIFNDDRMVLKDSTAVMNVCTYIK